MKVTLGDKFGDKLRNVKTATREELLIDQFLEWLKKRGIKLDSQLRQQFFKEKGDAAQQDTDDAQNGDKAATRRVGS